MPLLVANSSAGIPGAFAVGIALLVALGVRYGIRYDPWRALARRHTAPSASQGTLFRRCSARFGLQAHHSLTVDVTVSPAGVYVDRCDLYLWPPRGRPLLLPWTGIRSAVSEKLPLSKPKLTLVFLEGTIACWIYLPVDALASVRESAGPHFSMLDSTDLFARN